MAEFAETAHEKAESAGGKGRYAILLDRSFVRGRGVSIVTATHGPSWHLFRSVMWPCQCGIVRGTLDSAIYDSERDRIIIPPYSIVIKYDMKLLIFLNLIFMDSWVGRWIIDIYIYINI
jgi:hypothetical protein